MIHGLDHVMLAVADFAAATSAATTMLGRDPDRIGPLAGMEAASFQLANTTLHLVHGSGPLAPEVPEGTAAITAAAGFAVENLDTAMALLARRGARCDGDAFSWTTADGTATRAARLTGAASNGPTLLLVERPAARPTTGLGLDHIVIRTPAPDRALALYGARLGLDLRLDRSNPAWGTRFLFFRCGDLVVEVVHPLAEPEGPGPDSFSGLAFRAPDIGHEHARLAANTGPISELRPGRKPGTHLFTVRSPAALVPTILIGAQPSPAPAQ